MLRRSEIETAYAALFEPNSDKFSKSHSQELCSANGHQIRMMGLNTGQQVRIDRPTANGTTFAIYTVSGAHDEELNHVFLADPFCDYQNAQLLRVGKLFLLNGSRKKNSR